MKAISQAAPLCVVCRKRRTLNQKKVCTQCIDIEEDYFRDPIPQHRRKRYVVANKRILAQIAR